MPGHYRVVLKPGDIRRRQDVAGVAAAIADWARTSAPDLEIGGPTTAPGHIAEGALAPTGLRVRLERWPGRDGQVLAIRSIPEDLTEQRQERVATAVERKLPKLAKASEGQRRSLLVLESDDLALGNYVEIASAATLAIRGRKDIPDVICLVETELGADVWLVKEFSEAFPDVPSPGPLPR